MKTKREKTLTEIEIGEYIKSLRFDYMFGAKSAISYLLKVAETTGDCSVNALLPFMGHKPIQEWQDWGWTNLSWDLLSNKYGAAFRSKGDDTYFVLQLPPVKRISRGIPSFDDVMGIFSERFIGAMARIKLDYLNSGHMSCDIIYNHIPRTYEVVWLQMMSKDELTLCLKVSGREVTASFANISDDLYRLTQVSYEK